MGNCCKKAKTAEEAVAYETEGGDDTMFQDGEGYTYVWDDENRQVK